ncbi:helix-turn-helix domain-containing protein [Micromonospora sp. NPDC049107]|uniref:helix-turn-helix transcriptional regulator n=1 Tax=unclassified Micromonospora TaxID=2617518 RepID=UPI0033DFE40A
MQDIGRLPEVTDLWTHRKTAWFLKVTPGTLYVWVSKGIGPRSYKLNGSRRYDPRDVQEFLRERYARAIEGRGTDAAA